MPKPQGNELTEYLSGFLTSFLSLSQVKKLIDFALKPSGLEDCL